MLVPSRHNLNSFTREEYIRLISEIISENIESRNFVLSLNDENTVLDQKILHELKLLIRQLNTEIALNTMTTDLVQKKLEHYLKSSSFFTMLSKESFESFFNSLFIALPSDNENVKYGLNINLKTQGLSIEKRGKEKVSSQELSNDQEEGEEPDKNEKEEKRNVYIPPRHVLNVSLYANNCGLFALVLGVKIALEYQHINVNISKSLDFVRDISIADLQDANFQTDEMSKMLRNAMSEALSKDLAHKKKSFKRFLAAGANYLTSKNKNNFSAFPADMEAFSGSNKTFLYELYRAWTSVYHHIDGTNCQQTLRKINSIQIHTSEIDECYSSISAVLSQINKQNCTRLVKELFDKFYLGENDKIERICKLRILFFTTRCRPTSKLASDESKKLFYKEALKYFKTLYNQHYTKDNICLSNNFVLLVKFAILESLNFNSNGEIASPPTLENIILNCRALFAEIFVIPQWEEIYLQYYNYIKNTTVMLTGEEIGTLAKMWNIQLDIDIENNNITKFYDNRDEKMPHVVLCNPSRNHWQVVVTDPVIIQRFTHLPNSDDNTRSNKTEKSGILTYQGDMEAIFKKKTIPSAGIIFDNFLGEISYFDLESRTNRLAQYLRNQYGNAKRVALFLPQSIDYIVGFYALQAAGMVPMPMSPDADNPPDRLNSFLKNGKTDLIITNSLYRDHLFLFGDEAKRLPHFFIDVDLSKFEDCPDVKPNIQNKSDDLAYIVNTSGSSGKPKQVLVPYRGISSCIQGHIDALQITKEDRIAAFADVSFDAHIVEMGVAKFCGANLYIVPSEYRRNLQKLSDFYKLHRITVAVFVASMLRQCDPNDFPELRVIICTGEKIDEKIIQNWGNRLLVDGYGPAENTIATWLRIIRLIYNAQSTAIKIHDQSQRDSSYEKNAQNTSAQKNSVEKGLTISATTGQVTQIESKMVFIPGTKCFILEESETKPGAMLKPMQQGKQGEIYIAGEGLALGYSDELLTADRFFNIQHPYISDQTIRVYRTKDLGVENADGSIEIVGRLDNQVKVYGRQICAEEITEIIKLIPNVAKVCIDPKINEHGHPEFIAYIELTDTSIPLDLLQIYEKIENSLGQSFIPSKWILVKNLPKLASEKTTIGDITSLSIISSGRIRGIQNSQLQGPLEHELAKHFTDILKISDKDFTLYRDDNFFHLGGKSLQAIVLLNLLYVKYNVYISYDVFKFMPTIEQLARIIKRAEEKSQLLPIVTLYKEKRELDNAPIYCLYALLGDAERDYEQLKSQWTYPHPLYAINARGRNNPDDMDDNILAEAYDCYQAIKNHSPRDSKIVIGWSRGGVLAILVKHFAQMYGDNSFSVMMIDSESPTLVQAMTPEQSATFLQQFIEEHLLGQLSLKQMPINKKDLSLLSKDQQIIKTFDAIEKAIVSASDDTNLLNRRLIVTVRNSLLSTLNLSLKNIRVNCSMIVASETQVLHGTKNLGWPASITIDKTTMVNGDHQTIMHSNNIVKQIAELVQQFALSEQNRYLANYLAAALRATAIPDIDEEELQYYVPAKACHLNDNEKTFEIGEYVLQMFLKSEQKVLLLLGDSGIGKTTFLHHLALHLQKNKSANNEVVLYIPLGSYNSLTTPNLIETHLRRLGLSDVQIQHLKRFHKFIILLDGVDENDKGSFQNIYVLYNLEEWDAQYIVGCRSNYLINAQNYKLLFYPIRKSRILYTGLTELMIVPFDNGQIEKYVQLFLKNPPEGFEVPKEWRDGTRALAFISKLSLLRDTIRIPFFLCRLMQLLIEKLSEFNEEENQKSGNVNAPAKSADDQYMINESVILDAFVLSFWDRQVIKLMRNRALPDTGRDIRIDFEKFCIELAQTMKIRSETKITYIPGREPWEKFFGSTSRDLIRIREGGLLKRFNVVKTNERNINTPFRQNARQDFEQIKSGEVIGFFHDILIEYFVILGDYNLAREALRKQDHLSASTDVQQDASESKATFFNMFNTYFTDQLRNSKAAFFKPSVAVVPPVSSSTFSVDKSTISTEIKGGIAAPQSPTHNYTNNDYDEELMKIAIAMSMGLKS